MFQSDSREQLRGKPSEYVTNYDRVLEKLLDKFGKPANFSQRGKVVIETLEGESSNQADRSSSIYRWCPAHGDNEFHTDCAASVTLALEPRHGHGHRVVFNSAGLGVRLRARRTRRATVSTGCFTPEGRVRREADRRLQRACRNVEVVAERSGQRGLPGLTRPHCVIDEA